MIIEELRVCNGCGEKTTEYIKINCPVCGRELVRCKECRINKIEIVCECGFKMP